MASASLQRVSVAIAAALVAAVVFVYVVKRRGPAPAAASTASASAEAPLPGPAPGDGARAEAAVRLTFDAIAKGDCETFTSSTTGEVAKRIKEQSCKTLFESYDEHKFRLVRTEGTEPDGRSPATARMVKIRVTLETKEKAALARVEKLGDVWKVAAF